MSFEARYDGRCAADCGASIEVGDLVEYVDDVLVHEGCPPGERVRRASSKPAEVCSVCFIEKPCECDDERKTA